MNSSELSICYVTPTYLGDMKRFALLRHSIRLFSPTIPHFVIVDEEELNIFKSQFKDEKNMTLLSSADVLPSRLEKKRILFTKVKNSFLEKLGWRFGFKVDHLDGWLMQQFKKIYFLNAMDADAAVFLDSDMIFLNPTEPQYFFNPQGALRILETTASCVEDFGFSVSAHVMMGTHIASTPIFFNYIHLAPRFLKSTGQVLLKHLEITHGGIRWESRFSQQQWPAEYNLMGFAARELQHLKGYVVEPVVTTGYEVYDENKLDETFSACLQDKMEKKFIRVQSNMGIVGEAFYTKMHAFLEQLAH